MTPSDTRSPSQPTPQSLTPETLRAWVHLTNLQFGSRLLTALLQRYDNAPQAIFDATDAQLGEVSELQPRHLVRLRDPSLVPTPRQMAWAERPDVRIVRSGGTDYPRSLHNILDPPPILFVRGSLEETDRFGVGMVGSRRATPYGRSVAERLARELVGRGLTVISGGATGIDAAAHRGALSAGGRTLAILGCGIDVDYPREHRALFEQVVAQGALISEYPLGAQPESWRFPLRNRLISGLSQGVLVVEAPQTSGALITARYAAEQGRTVMAVPGNIDREASQGTNQLIKDGAVLVTEVNDILHALGMVVLPARPEHQVAFELNWESAEADSGSPQNLSQVSAQGLQQGSPRGLSAAQQKLLSMLSLTPRHIDSVAQEASMTATQAGVEMTLLELTGLVRRLPGNTYIRAL